MDLDHLLDKSVQPLHALKLYHHTDFEATASNDGKSPFTFTTKCFRVTGYFEKVRR